MMKGGGNHKRSKHFTIDFDALREYVREKEIDIKYIQTEKMPADMLTKSLGKTSFQVHRDSIMRGNGQRYQKQTCRWVWRGAREQGYK